MSSGVSQDLFLKNYTKALLEGNAAIFVGAGLSRASGYVDWKELLRGIAEQLELDINQETDLVALAQYSRNNRGNRAHLNQLLVEEFADQEQPSVNHDLLASMPIDTVWTTNYDDLLERAFEQAEKRCDVKHRQTQLSTTRRGRAVTIYKMHGDRTLPDEAVLTKDDYESYDSKRKLFSEKLQGDLIGKTFVFLGFSLTDPNIDHILSRIRVLLGENQREHFCIMKSLTPPTSTDPDKVAEYEYDKRKLEYRIEDLKRYSIQAVLIDEYDDLTGLLQELNRRSHQQDVFVSGCAHDFGPLGEDKLKSLCRMLGELLIEKGLNVVSGFGLGIGGEIILGAMKVLGRNDEHRLHLRPFPQQAPAGVSLPDFKNEYRERMISRAGACVFISGNKLDNGNVVPAKGVKSEFDICCRQGKFPIPIGATGHVAKELWTTVKNDLNRYFPSKDVQADFEVIGDSSKTEEELVAAVLRIVETIS